ncbi:MAG: hypothetical protein QOG32_292 [Chloroflexota bacterium]|nr:hypothetical protein [Chloroflexota bacterium]
MIKSLKFRRAFVVLGVVASLVVGLLSIEVASALTVAAAPPAAPPMSLSALQSALADQQQRGDALQSQLTEMTDLTATLQQALSGTKDYVSTQGQTAKGLEGQLSAARAKLATLQGLLNAAQARLAALRQAAANVGSGGGTPSGSKPRTPAPKPPTSTPAPTPVPQSGGGGATTLSLTLSISGGGVRAEWSACNVSGFAAYALVRSRDSEIHYPPEDLDTEVAHITSASTTVGFDSAAPTGRMTYTVYCLTRNGQEFVVARKSAAKQIQVP